MCESTMDKKTFSTKSIPVNAREVTAVSCFYTLTRSSQSWLMWFKAFNELKPIQMYQVEGPGILKINSSPLHETHKSQTSVVTQKHLLLEQ